MQEIWEEERHKPKRSFKKKLNTIKSRCKYGTDKNHQSYKKKGIKCFLTVDDLIFLWKRDKAWNLKYPTIDRKDNDGNYTLNNCRYIERSENTARSNGKHSKETIEKMRKAERKNIGRIPVSMFKDGVLINKFPSIKEAARKTGSDPGSICRTLSGEYSHHKGYQWKNQII